MKENTLRLSSLPDLEVLAHYVEMDCHDPKNEYETHIHRECEIYVNLSGDVTFEVENRIYPIQRGSVILTRPYEYHHCIYHSEKLHRHYWILLGGADSPDLFRPFYDREKGEDNLIQLSEEALSRLCSHLDTLLDPSASPLTHRLSLLHVMQLLDGERDSAQGERFSTLPTDVTLALNYMDDHLREPVDWKDLTTHCFVSTNTLERHFKQALQITPSAMLRKKRLIHSARLLRQGATVSAACEESGFTDYSGYIATFRRFFGTTPLQYQKSFEKQ